MLGRVVSDDQRQCLLLLSLILQGLKRNERNVLLNVLDQRVAGELSEVKYLAQPRRGGK